jgi:2-polyprenyl-3-methyl-5-hydroxy-6-metoxy-1,4-benzoquinol methylase
MKLRLGAENLLEWIALRFNLAPRPLIETQVAFSAAMAIMTAAELGIFQALGTGARKAQEVADSCGTHPRGTQELLNCLVGVGYLRWSHGTYSLKRSYRKWLLSGSQVNLLAKLRLQLLEWNWLGKLGEYVRNGQPLDLHRSFSATEWELYQEGMRDLSFAAAREMATKIPVPPGATRMLDIGGSHGLYSIELCERHPALASTIMELPGAIESSRAIARRYDTTGRVTHEPGNVLTDDLTENAYDLVLINNLVHHFTEEQNRAVAAKVARALKPSGIYAIGDMIRTDTPGEGGVIASTLSLYFSLTSAGRNWSTREMESWQSAAGLVPKGTVSFASLPGWKMVIARKPAASL